MLEKLNRMREKETFGTQYWLKLLFHSSYLSGIEYNSILLDTMEVGKILTSSIKTKKKIEQSKSFQSLQ